MIFHEILHFHLTMASSNEKTGPIPVSTTSAASCPDCALKEVCYAAGGPMAIFWAQLTAGQKGVTFELFLNSVSTIPMGALWRHDQAGDLPGKGNVIDVDALAALVETNRGRRGFTYTHKPVLSGPYAEVNAAAVAQANANGFTINLSGNNPSHADQLAALAIAPVTTVLPMELQRQYNKAGWLESLEDYRARIKGMKTPNGRTIVVCPATYLDDVTCGGGKVKGKMTKACELCQKQRSAIVGFPAHGARKRAASEIARQQ